ncbi:MAG: cytochrome P450 [Mucilaginibacter sp.]
MNTKYNFPNGFTRLQSLAKSFKVINDPLGAVTLNMKRFSNTYSTFIPGKGRVIVTQDGDFANYILRENHTNYKKAQLGSAIAVRQLGDSLLFANGEDWRRQRRLIQPAFHHAGIQQLYQTVIDTINLFVARLPEGEEIDVYPLMRDLSFSVLISSLFNIDMSQQMTNDLCRAFVDLQNFILKDVFQPFRRIMYPVTGEEKRLAKQWEDVRNMLKGIIAIRREGDKSHSDLLNMLLSARYEDTGEAMDDDRLISELLILLFAGHETTGATVSWLLHLIASDGDVLKKLTGRIADIDIMDSPRDSYINAVINEGMRLYPAVWVAERLTINDDNFGGYSYPAGTSILTYFYGMHRLPAYWENAEKFNPQRFLTPDGTINKNIKSYFPFGAGPRMCIGNNFAMAEISFILYTIFKKFDIKNTVSTPVPWPLLTMRPREVILNIKRYYTD